MNADEAIRRLTEAIRRERLGLATEGSYCEYLKRPQFHLPSEQEPERFPTAPTAKDAAASPQTQAFNAIVFEA